MKKRIRKTGEIVDVISYNDCNDTKRHSYDWVAYVDKNGDEWNVPMNFFLDFKDVEEELTKEIDWEQRRYEIAKEAISAIMSNGEFYDQVLYEGAQLNGSRTIPVNISHAAVVFADALIAELKKGEIG